MNVPRCGWRRCVLNVGLLLLALSLPQALLAQWKASVGAQSKDLGRQALAFLPNEIWIHEGESITWTFETAEIHPVSFSAGRASAIAVSSWMPGCDGEQREL